MSKNLTAACGYLRMSSDDQEDSIEQQRPIVTDYARQKGYRIIRWYVDSGKSGSKEVEKRTDFQRLLMDATKSDFEAVLCYDAARFARLDTIDGAFAKQILRQNGIYLDTVKEGKIDWRDQDGRMKDFMLSEANSAFARNLSRDSLRGRMKCLADGYWCFGAVPYGYDRLYIHDAQRHIVKRTERFRKPQNWKLKLVVNEDEKRVVEFVFDEFVNRNQSRRQIAFSLNAKGIPGPDAHGRSNGWHKGAINNILGNMAYIGSCQFGVARKRKKEAFNRAVPTIKEGVCPAIIKAKLFQQAQDRRESDEQHGKVTRSSQAGALSGVLVCGNCGYRLRKLVRKDVKTQRIRYACDSSRRYPHLGCGTWTADEREVMPVIMAELSKVIRNEIATITSAKPVEPSSVDILAEQLKQLRGKLATAERRMSDEDDDELYAIHRDRVKELRKEVSESESRLAVMSAVENKGGVGALAADAEEIDRVVQAMIAGSHEVKLGEGRYTLVDTDTLRAMLARFGVSVTLFWVRRSERGKWHLDKGRLAVGIDWTEGDSQADVLRCAEGEHTTTHNPSAPKYIREVVFKFR